MTRLPPLRVARAATGVRTALQGLTRRMVPPEVGTLELAAAFMATQAAYAVARLRIADALAVGPRSAPDVASEVGTDPDATYRLLRAAATHGIVRHDGDRFALTGVGRTLVSDAPGSMRSVVLMIGDPRYQSVWGQLPEAVRTGGPRAAAVHGVSMWELLERDTGYAQDFNDAMGRLTALDWPTVDAVYDFTPFGTIVDVGGGHGQLLSLMLGAAPAAKGVLLEQPSMVGEAEKQLGAAGLLHRCRLVGASFFETAPDDGDLYVLRRVVHDFDDDQAVALLTNLRRHMPSTAALLLMESVVPDGGEPQFAKLLDLDMLLFVGGRERTEAELASLLERAGFQMTRVVPTISTISLVEARPGA
ncbi:acetylserotonin O-methyltransferase [Nocardioides KLBMP 9356]|uniref:Acetylserotonin O-methyltransferase n=1 Tax=Nocardioides potassii TaxID=2911371 RepID=A0ABS9H9T6_9ACTN|nr:acetylserotonin O-methyltransferase [Nocardioides potassii]MCF6377977.1 acetylserotonin O-methyltransferase [Nocardioides potassii]